MAGVGLGLGGRAVPVMLALPEPGLLLLKIDNAMLPASATIMYRLHHNMCR